MSEAHKTIWARVRTYTRFYGPNVETEERRDWCEGYATPEIAKTCEANEYTLTSSVSAQLKAAVMARGWYKPLCIVKRPVGLALCRSNRLGGCNA